MAPPGKVPLQGGGWSDDQQSMRPSPQMGAAPLQKKTARDLYREPAPLRRDIETDLPGDVTIDGPDDDQIIHVDGKTGAAWTERDDGVVVIDFGGGANLKPDVDRGPGNFDDNLAERDDVDCANIAARLLEGIEADIDARREWSDMGIRGADMLGVKWEEPSTEVSPDGFLSKINAPWLLRAVIQMWGASRAELLPASGPVKVRDDEPRLERQAGSDTHTGVAGAGAPTPGAPAAEPPRRSDLADELERDLNHYLTAVDREYYPDTSRMLMMRALKGSQFKKVYFCPIERRPVSRWIAGTNLIISNDASSLSKAGRVTEYSRMRQSTVKRLQSTDWWRKTPLVEPAPEATSVEISNAQLEGIQPIPQLPADYQHHIYECNCELDEGPLAKDETGKTPGFPLPYRVTIDKDSQQVLEIRRNWKAGDPQYRPRRRYVHFGMVPGLGFYHWGFLHILAGCQRGGTAMLREFIDAEMFASFPGGVMAKTPGASRNDQTLIRPPPGHFVVVDTGGMPIGDAIHEWPYKGASPGLVQGIQYLDAAAKELSGTVELPVGEGRVGDVPVGTIMAYIEAVQKVPSAVHKDDHMAQAEEFELLKELFEETPECLEPHEGGSREWTQEMLADHKLVPAADPNTPSAAHRLMKGTAMVQMAAMPNFMQVTNQRKVLKRAYEILGIEDGDDYVMPEPPPPAPGAQPPPDPQAMAAMAKLQVDQQKNQIEAQKAQQKQVDTQRQAATSVADNEQRDKDRQLEAQTEQTRLKIEEMRAQREHQQANREMAMEHQRGILSEVGEHIRHGQTLAQQDRHHADDQATQRQQTQQQGILALNKGSQEDQE